MEPDPLLHSYYCTCGEEMRIGEFHAGRMVPCPRCRAFVIVPEEFGGQAVEPRFEMATERLRIDLATRRHWRELQPVFEAPENYVYEVSSPATPRETRKALKSTEFPAGFSKSHRLKFRVVEAREERTIGTVTVAFSLPYYGVELGFMIHHLEHGRGYGTEAVGAVVDWLFEELHVHRISAMCDSRNKPSIALLERVGFVREGEQKEFYHHPERGWLDSPMYALFREARCEARSADGSGDGRIRFLAGDGVDPPA